MPDPETVLHMGFHKTGASRLHSILDHNRDALERQGVHAVHHRQMRKGFTAPCQQNAAGSRQGDMNDKRLRKLTKRFFDQATKSEASRIILTDQNIAGAVRPSVRTGQLYRHCDPIMQVVAAQIPFKVSEIHLVVRNYADFFTALYVDHIRDLKKRDIQGFLTPRLMCDAVFKRLAGWDNVILPIRSRFPDSKIRLWRYESFGNGPDAMVPLVQHLVGEDVAAMTLDQVSPPPAQTLSGDTVAEVELRVKTDPDNAIGGALRALLKADNGGAPFDPWRDWERDHLNRLYDRDIVRLGTDKAITIMQAA